MRVIIGNTESEVVSKEDVEKKKYEEELSYYKTREIQFIGFIVVIIIVMIITIATSEKVVAVLYKCDNNYKLTSDNKCVTDNIINLNEKTCPKGILVDDYCEVGEEKRPDIKCPTGFSKADDNDADNTDNKACYKETTEEREDSINCPAGMKYNVERDKCLTANPERAKVTIKCPPGATMVTHLNQEKYCYETPFGEYKPNDPGDLSKGFTCEDIPGVMGFKNGRCYKDPVDKRKEINCKADEKVLDGYCYREAEAIKNNKCKEGFKDVGDNLCIKKEYSDIIESCDNGYDLKNGKCIKTNKVKPKMVGECKGEDLKMINNTCYQVVNAIEYCPDGYALSENKCKKTK